jgi:hypothetical protein
MIIAIAIVVALMAVMLIAALARVHDVVGGL